MTTISYWFGSYFSSLGLLIVSIGFFFALIYFMMNKKFTRFFARPIFNFFVPGRHKTKFKTGFDDFYKSISDLKSKKRRMTLILLFTIIIWLMSILQVYLTSTALGINVSYEFLLAIISMVAIIELIPISVMGLGTREAFFIFSLSLIGISSQMAVAFSVLYLIVGFWLAGILGFIFWIKKPVKLKI